MGSFSALFTSAAWAALLVIHGEASQWTVRTFSATTGAATNTSVSVIVTDTPLDDDDELSVLFQTSDVSGFDRASLVIDPTGPEYKVLGFEVNKSGITRVRCSRAAGRG